MSTAVLADKNTNRQRRAFWLKQMHAWHWISSALCLIGMLLFAVTGLTLNHASAVHSEPKVTKKQATVPPATLVHLQGRNAPPKGPLPEPVVEWLRSHMSVYTAGREGEWSEGEVYVSLPRPGGDAWLTVDRSSGAVQYELTDRGYIAYLNDLHKGRNTGAAWSWFLDVFAVSCLVFCITGLFLLQLHAGNRPTTWPLVGLGLVIPLVLAILFIH